MSVNIPQYTLNDGVSVPAMALGTYKLNGVAGVAAMLSAIEQGYRFLDSAFNYENEGALGQAMREAERRFGVRREDVVLASKLPGRRHAYDQAIDTVHESLYRAGLDYWDLYLIHWPNPKVGLYVEAFQALVELQKQGLIRSVGVSNFLPEHLERLCDEVGVLPSVNQIELHPYFPQVEALHVHEELGVRTQSWSPLGRNNGSTNEAVVRKIAQAHGVTPVQVVLAWHVQRGSIPLPKSANAGRQRENLQAVECRLNPAELEAITALGRADGRMKGQDPAVYEEF